MLKKKIAIAVALALSAGAQAAGPAVSASSNPAASHSPGSADLAASLAQMRAQIEEMKRSYEQRIATLEQKLSQAEARPGQGAVGPASAAGSATAASPVVASSPASAVTPSVASGGMVAAGAGAGSQTPGAHSPGYLEQGGGRFNPEVSLILQGQYKQMKAVEEPGITGFWPADGHDHGGPRRGFVLDHTELIMAANIDPNWRGQAILALLDGEVEVEEAWFQSLGLGGRLGGGLGSGLGLKVGRYRSGIGYLNEQHPHQWDFADAPLMYRALFGSHATYRQDGVQVKWLAPTPVFLEFGAELGRGDTFPGTDRNKNGSGAGAFFAHAGGDIGLAHSWRAGLSYLRTSPRDRIGDFEGAGGGEAEGAFSGRSRTWVADFVWKWAPDGNPKYRNFKLQAEYFNRRESGDLATDNAAGIFRTRQSGWYVQGVYQFNPNWRAGYRHDRLHGGDSDIGSAIFADLAADNGAFGRYSPRRDTLMADYSWSEFSRVRLQYARDRSLQGVSDNQVTLQYIMSLGAHGAHKF